MKTTEKCIKEIAIGILIVAVLIVTLRCCSAESKPVVVGDISTATSGVIVRIDGQDYILLNEADNGQ